MKILNEYQSFKEKFFEFLSYFNNVIEDGMELIILFSAKSIYIKLLKLLIEWGIDPFKLYDINSIEVIW